MNGRGQVSEELPSYREVNWMLSGFQLFLFATLKKERDNLLADASQNSKSSHSSCSQRKIEMN